MTSDQMNEIKRHFNVVAEGLQHELRLIVESNATIERMVTEHRAETRHDKRELQAVIQTVHDSLKTEIREVGERVDGHESRISILEKKVA